MGRFANLERLLVNRWKKKRQWGDSGLNLLQSLQNRAESTPLVPKTLPYVPFVLTAPNSRWDRCIWRSTFVNAKTHCFSLCKTKGIPLENLYFSNNKNLTVKRLYLRDQLELRRQTVHRVNSFRPQQSIPHVSRTIGASYGHCLLTVSFFSPIHK